MQQLLIRPASNLSPPFFDFLLQLPVEALKKQGLTGV
jgi:hypothetical protein